MGAGRRLAASMIKASECPVVTSSCCSAKAHAGDPAVVGNVRGTGDCTQTLSVRSPSTFRTPIHLSEEALEQRIAQRVDRRVSVYPVKILRPLT
jgi:hypothetical protein